MISSLVIVLILLLVLFRLYIRSLRISYPYNDLYVLISGCDTGFGKATAERFDRLGFHIFALCHTEQGCQHLMTNSSSRLVPIRADLTKSDDVMHALKVVEQNLPPEKGLWAVINNAGIAGTFGLFESLEPHEYLKCFDINVVGMVRVNKLFLPLLRKSHGRIINISSIAGRFAFSFASPYVASKYSVEGYSDAIRRELYKQGVRVIIIEPSGFKTGFISSAITEDATQRNFARLPQESQNYFGHDYVKRCMKHYKGDHFMHEDVSKVVDTYLDAVTSRYPKYRYLVGLDANIFFRFLFMIPEWLSDFIIVGNMEKPRAELRKNSRVL